MRKPTFKKFNGGTGINKNSGTLWSNTASQIRLWLDDVSSVGIGALLSHQTKDGTERSITYASRSLTKAELNYSQLSAWEAMNIIWDVQKF